MTHESITSWSADHLRVSLFSVGVWSASSETIFNDVFAVAPESVTSRPASVEMSAVGTWEGSRLEIKRTFNRIDFILQAIPSELSPIALIPDVQLILPKFSAAVAKWASSQSQGIVRIAVGCGAFFPASGLIDSYVKLRELVKVINVDVERFREFRFQVNLPITSEVLHDLRINRLTNWASVAFRAGLIGADNAHFFDEKFYCTCGLDVNTDADRAESFSVDIIEKLSQELCAVNLDVLAYGIE